ncbi:MAG: hypothetical protein JWN78_1287, partial [Bacteroidota bacterium]|nr:hypothetical protein [Bacteroidota bacterium]
QYPHEGSYQVCLYVQDIMGCTDSMCKTVSILGSCDTSWLTQYKTCDNTSIKEYYSDSLGPFYAVLHVYGNIGGGVDDPQITYYKCNGEYIGICGSDSFACNYKNDSTVQFVRKVWSCYPCDDVSWLLRYHAYTDTMHDLKVHDGGAFDELIESHFDGELISQNAWARSGFIFFVYDSNTGTNWQTYQVGNTCRGPFHNITCGQYPTNIFEFKTRGIDSIRQERQYLKDFLDSIPCNAYVMGYSFFDAGYSQWAADSINPGDVSLFKAFEDLGVSTIRQQEENKPFVFFLQKCNPLVPAIEIKSDSFYGIIDTTFRFRDSKINNIICKNQSINEYLAYGEMKYFEVVPFDVTKPKNYYRCDGSKVGYCGITDDSTIYFHYVDSICNDFLSHLQFVGNVWSCSTTEYCDIIPQDTVRNNSDTVLQFANSHYELPPLANHKFKVMYWGIAHDTLLTPSNVFDSILELVSYMNAIDHNNWAWDGSYTLNAIDNNEQRYQGGDGFKIYDMDNHDTYYVLFETRESLPMIIYTIPLNFYEASDTSKFIFSSYPRAIPTADTMIQFYLPVFEYTTLIVHNKQLNCSDTVVINSDSIVCNFATSCVFAGDADHDFTVNNFDVLAVGLSYNRTGPARLHSSTQFFPPQFCYNWSTTHYYGFNDKFSDCNGDGIINTGDIGVIDQNYIIQPENIFHHRMQQDSLPSITLDFDTVPAVVVIGDCTGAQLTADIIVGDSVMPANDEYGIAFSVNYPFDSSTCFNVVVETDSSSWFQTNDSIIVFYKNIPQYKRVDIAITRLDGTSRSGVGKLGTIKLITEGDIFGIHAHKSMSSAFEFSITNAVAVNNAGVRKDVLGSTTQVNFIVVNTKQNKVEGLKIFPNPANSKVFISAAESIESVRILDMAGKVVYQSFPGTNNIQLDISVINKGLYFLEIKGRNTSTFEKLVKQ